MKGASLGAFVVGMVWLLLVMLDQPFFSERTWYQVHSDCAEVDAAALAQKVSDCAGSAASDEGASIVLQCEDTMRRVLCTRQRWTYEELTGSSWNGNRVTGRGLCSKGPPSAQKACRWEGWDGR